MTYVEAEGPGSWLEAPLEVEEAGDYSISAYEVLEDDSGIWSVTLDGPGGERLLHPGLDWEPKGAPARR